MGVSKHNQARRQHHILPSAYGRFAYFLSIFISFDFFYLFAQEGYSTRVTAFEFGEVEGVGWWSGGGLEKSP